MHSLHVQIRCSSGSKGCANWTRPCYLTQVATNTIRLVRTNNKSQSLGQYIYWILEMIQTLNKDQIKRKGVAHFEYMVIHYTRWRGRHIAREKSNREATDGRWQCQDESIFEKRDIILYLPLTLSNLLPKPYTESALTSSPNGVLSMTPFCLFSTFYLSSKMTTLLGLFIPLVTELYS
jgi:hypothetical protein